MEYSKKIISNRNTVDPSVLEHAKNLNPADLPHAWVFYNENEVDYKNKFMEKIFYINEEYPVIVEAENYELVQTNSNDSNDSIWVILPLSATKYVFYRKTTIPIQEYYFARNVLVEWGSAIRNSIYFITELETI